MGDFSFKYVDDAEDGEPVVHNEAAVFTHAGGKVFLYRGKDGDWIIGTSGYVGIYFIVTQILICSVCFVELETNFCDVSTITTFTWMKSLLHLKHY